MTENPKLNLSPAGSLRKSRHLSTKKMAMRVAGAAAAGIGSGLLFNWLGGMVYMSQEIPVIADAIAVSFCVLNRNRMTGLLSFLLFLWGFTVMYYTGFLTSYPDWLYAPLILLSACLGVLIWYARGKGIPGVIISGFVLGWIADNALAGAVYAFSWMDIASGLLAVLICGFSLLGTHKKDWNWKRAVCIFAVAGCTAALLMFL